jgi:hypothetical protein
MILVCNIILAFPPNLQPTRAWAAVARQSL